jgi:lysine decarboxylase
VTDDAWGAHFIFHPQFPDSAIATGTDIAVSSMHKAGSGLMQGSLIAVQGDLVDRTRLKHTLSLLESSSTSMLILTALDGARRRLAIAGEAVLGRTLELAGLLRTGIADIHGLRVMGREVLEHPGALDLDETKVLIDVTGLGTTGFRASDWLLENHSIAMELADQRHLLAMVTLADDHETVHRLLVGLTALAQQASAISAGMPSTPPAPADLVAELAMNPRDAFFAGREKVAIEDAEGRVAAEAVVPYPPGIPILVPGERWTRPIIDYLRQALNAGMHVTDVADSKLETVIVVDDSTRAGS